MKPDEAAFESHIAEWLADHGGYTAWKLGTGSTDFDPGRGLDTAELFAFIEDTQPDEWAKVLKTHAGNQATARAGFLDRLTKELDARGTVDVLRHGLVYAGHEKAEFTLAWFRPASGLNPVLAQRYISNRLTVIRQLPYERRSNKTIDLGLFVNGIPVATAEVKNHLTGQTVDNAKTQYRTDRDRKSDDGSEIAEGTATRLTTEILLDHPDSLRIEQSRADSLGEPRCIEPCRVWS